MEQLNIKLEDLNKFATYRKPDTEFTYEISPELNDAVQVALLLNQPLLLTGDPGTGKTTLAEKVAADLHNITNGNYRKKPYVFDTKSISAYSDLFYTYDAIGHFYEANIKKERKPDIKEFIELNALGSAIAASMTPEERGEIPARNIPSIEEPRNSVVLIDEIDKASRDFPNNLLNELDRYCFSIKEHSMRSFSKEDDAKILVILTSNNEKDLPHAFLRRCIYFQIDFPGSTMLKTIIERHALLELLQGREDILIERFNDLRDICKNKQPATAELIAWCRLIIQRNIDPADNISLVNTLSVVVKDQEDRNAVLNKWNSNS